MQTTLVEALIAVMDFQSALWLFEGKVPGQAGNNHPYFIPTGTFPTSDGYINIGSGTQQMTSRAVGVPAAKMKGTDAGGSGGVVTQVSGSAMPEKTIGILAADAYDGKRDVLTALAFQSFHQWNAYYADSTATSLDKKNVRDGHYSVWGPVHMLVQVNPGTGAPISAGAKNFVDWVQGTPTTPAAPFDILDIQIGGRLNVGANQAGGTYVGSFPVTTDYF